jgi:hypothetical protein
MRRALVVLVVATLPSIAHAQTAVGVGIGSGSATSQSGSVAISGQGGGGGSGAAQAGGGNVTFNQGSVPANTTSRSDGTIDQTVTSRGGTSSVSRQTGGLRNVPSTFAPGLAAAGLETCLGSISGGVSGMGFGVALGSTVPDPGCSARLDARQLWSFGLKKAAIARMCLSSDVQRSMPEVCAEYLPQQAQQAGYVANVASAPVARLEPAPYQGGRVQVTERRTGQLRWCDRYANGRCLQWSR